MALAIDGNEEDARQRLRKEPLPLALPKAMKAEDRRIGRVALRPVRKLPAGFQRADLLFNLNKQRAERAAARTDPS